MFLTFHHLSNAFHAKSELKRVIVRYTVSPCDGGVCRDEVSGADFGQEEERVGHNTGGEYQVPSRAK